MSVKIVRRLRLVLDLPLSKGILPLQPKKVSHSTATLFLVADLFSTGLVFINHPMKRLVQQPMRRPVMSHMRCSKIDWQNKRSVTEQQNPANHFDRTSSICNTTITAHITFSAINSHYVRGRSYHRRAGPRSAKARRTVSMEPWSL